MIDVETIFDSDREEYEFMQEKKEKPMKEMPIRFFNDDGTPNQETIETIKELAQSRCSGDTKCPDCSPQCGVYNYAIKELTGSKDCVHCINPYQTNPYEYCPYCGRGLGKNRREKQKDYVDPFDLTPNFCPCCGERVTRGRRNDEIQ